MPRLTHVNAKGDVQMVTVSDKSITRRTATASAKVTLSYGAFCAISSNKKGDVLATCRVAGIMASKQTAMLIPLCHNIPIDHVTVDLVLPTVATPPNTEVDIIIICTVACTGRTGVEMEAMFGVSVAALTLYDMCKAVDKRIVIKDVQLEQKAGGRSGDFTR